MVQPQEQKFNMINIVHATRPQTVEEVKELLLENKDPMTNEFAHDIFHWSIVEIMRECGYIMAPDCVWYKKETKSELISGGDNSLNDLNEHLNEIAR